MKILIMGAFSSLNKGDEARVKATIKSIRKFIHNADFGFLSPQPSLDKKIYNGLGITIIDKYNKQYNNNFLSKTLKCLEMLSLTLQIIIERISKKSNNNTIRELKNYDVFLDLSGESISDYFGQINLFFCLYQIYIGILLKKRVVIYAQSIGPLDNPISRYIASFILNKVNLITVRDKESLDNLKRYRINRPSIYLTADPAFNLKPASSERTNKIVSQENIKTSNCLIGISISRGSFKRSTSINKDLDRSYRNYIQVIVRLIDYIIQKLNADIIFIPHVIAPNEDDRLIYEEIHKLVKNKSRFRMLRGDYNSEELKGIIGNCDIFIGSRMHAIIAALSMNVPTIAISYSHKIPNLMRMVGQEEFVFDINDITFEAIRLKFDSIWTQRMMIKENLLHKIKFVRKMGLYNAKILKQLLNS